MLNKKNLLTITICVVTLLFGSLIPIRGFILIGNAQTIINITKPADTNDGACTPADCSLREAVIAANATPGSTIQIPAGVYTLALGTSGEEFSLGGDLDVRANMTLIGLGDVTINGGGLDRVFHVHSGMVVLENVDLRNGNAAGGGLRIEALANVTLRDVTLSGNRSNVEGGGVYNLGSLTLTSTTLSSNTAGWDGGGVYSTGNLFMNNTTLSGNSANRHGGGLALGGGNAMLASTTVAGNIADANYSGVGDGGGVYRAVGVLSLQNTLIGDNRDRSNEMPDCAGAVSSNDYNLIENTAGCSISGAVAHNLYGVDPNLLALADNGGATETHALSFLSPAIDAANPLGCAATGGGLLGDDQRGVMRPQDGNNDGVALCDIGAYEIEALSTTTITSLTHTLTSTDQAFTSGSTVAIGEIITYQTRFTLPPGVVGNAQLVVNLGAGLAAVSCHEITSSSVQVVTTMPGGLSGVCSNAAISAEPVGNAAPETQGRQVIYRFGNLSNHGTLENSVTVTTRVIVLDVAGNQSGVSLVSDASWTSSGGNMSASAATVSIAEPALLLTLTAMPSSGFGASAITFTMTVQHASGSQTPAHDLDLAAVLSGKITLTPGSLNLQSGTTPDVMNESTNGVNLAWDALPLGASAVITFEGMQYKLFPGDYADVTGALTWSSLPGDYQASISSHNVYSTERYYSPASAVDDYRITDGWRNERPELPESGFAPNRLTTLPDKPDGLAYSTQSGMAMTIPELGVSSRVTGIPISDTGWDIRWLGADIGHLAGTTIPTWEGNAVFTAHTSLATGESGPFALLDTLRWGDQIRLTAYGKTYIYEVRSLTYVLPDNAAATAPKDGNWITLITCKGYDEKTGKFLFRVVVQAVLVAIE